MNHQERNDLFFDTLARVLIRAFLLGAALLVFWFLGFLLAAHWMYAVHSQWFEITRHEFDVIHYCGMGLLKIGILLLFLLPYVSIRLVQRQRKKTD